MAQQRTDRGQQKRSRTIRWAILLAILVVVTAMVTAHQYFNGAGRPVGVDALCPFGGLETLYTFLSGGSFIDKTAASALGLLLGSIVMAVVFRRSFCGQLCPLGTLQELFGKLGGKVAKRRPVVPRGVDRVARYLKYAILAFFTVWTWQAATLVMRPYDPWVAFAHLTSDELLAEFGVGVAVLGVSLAGSLVYDRFFCKYLCPTGAMLGLLSRFSVLRIARDADACTSCGACDKACPMNVDVSSVDAVTSSECISCNECVNSCPAAGALTISGPKRRVIPAAKTSVALVAGLAVLIAASTAAGSFAWRMPSLADAVEQSHEGEGGVLPASSAQAFDPSLIKGYMSMAEISEVSGIPAEKFTEKWGVPAADLGKPMKEIKDRYEFSPDDVRTWVAEELAP